MVARCWLACNPGFTLVVARCAASHLSRSKRGHVTQVMSGYQRIQLDTSFRTQYNILKQLHTNFLWEE